MKIFLIAILSIFCIPTALADKTYTCVCAGIRYAHHPHCGNGYAGAVFAAKREELLFKHVKKSYLGEEETKNMEKYGWAYNENSGWACKDNYR